MYRATPGMNGVTAFRVETPAEQQTRVVALAKETKEKSGRDAVPLNRQVSPQRIRMGYSLRPGR